MSVLPQNLVQQHVDDALHLFRLAVLEESLKDAAAVPGRPLGDGGCFTLKGCWM